MRLMLIAAAALVLPGIASAGDLQVTIAGVRNDQGNVLGAVFDQAGFLHVDKAKGTCHVKAAAGSVVCSFTDLPAGRWAVSVYHDENNNQKLDYNDSHIPLEGFGFSNDAVGSYGPPTFDQAAFDYDGKTKAVTINLEYAH